MKRMNDVGCLPAFGGSDEEEEKKIRSEKKTNPALRERRGWLCGV
jgi:hypothetical protein